MSNPKFKKNKNLLVKNIIENINILMDRKSLSIYDIERDVGRDNLRHLLAGRTKNPNIILIYEIVQKLGVTIKELIRDPKSDNDIIEIKYQKSAFTTIEENAVQILSRVQKAKLDFLIRNMVQNIHILIKQQSTSIYKVGKSVGSTNLADFLNGRRKTTSIIIIHEIAEALGVDIEDLLKVPINIVLEQEDNNSKNLKTDLTTLEEEIKNLLIEVQKLKNNI